MPDYNVQIKLDPKQVVSNSRVIERRLKIIEKQAERVRRAMLGAFQLAGIGFAVDQIVQLADAFTNIENRIRVVTDSQAELIAVTQKLFDISQATRVSVESTTELYSRLALTTRNLGTSQEELISFTETLNQALTLSGVTGAEAEGGLIQFSQGLGLGALKGDELRSVLEQIPVVADIIAKELGVVRSQLIKLGPTGVITTEVILRAFKNAGDDIRASFGQTLPTLSQAFTVLRNAVIKLAGDFDDSTNVFGIVAQAIITIANNIKLLTQTIITSLSVWAIWKISIEAIPFASAVAQSLKYIRAVATGRAVVLGSAQAEAQKATAIKEGIAQQVAATQATLNRTRAELNRSVVLRDSINLEGKRAVLLARISTLEKQAAAQQAALKGAIETVKTATGAELARAQAIIRGTTVETAATKATLAKTRADLASLKVTDNRINAEFARIAVQKQLIAIEKELAIQTAALTAATNAQTIANTRAAGSFSLLKSILPGVTAAVNRLTAAIAANPIGAIAVALTVIIALLVIFADDIKLSSDRLATLEDVGVAAWNRIKDSLSGFVDFFKNNFAPLFAQISEFFDNIEFSVAGIILFVSRGIDKFIGFWSIGYKVIVALWNGLPAALEEAFTLTFNRAIDLVESGIRKLTAGLNEFFAFVGLSIDLTDITFDRLENKAEGAIINLTNALDRAVREGLAFSGLTQYITGLFDEAEQIALARQRAIAQAEAERRRKEAERQRAEAARLRAEQALAFFKLFESLKQETDLLKVVSSEREILKALLKAEKKLKRELTGAEGELLEAILRENQALEFQTSLYEQIKSPITEYKDTLSALKVLVDQNKISQEEYNAALQETSLVSSLGDIRLDLSGEQAQTTQLATQLAERQLILDQALEARLISEQEFLSLSLQLNQDHAYKLANLEKERYRNQLQAGQNAFSALANASKGFVSEQSGIYRGLFAASKAFAVAESTVAIFQGIANASKLGWPANIGAIATTIAQTAGLISQIQGVQPSGFQTGGTFRVGGSGGPDSQLVQFKASPNETVSVRTPGQERAFARQETEMQQQPEINLTNVNVVDQNLLEDFLASPSGERVLINSIQRNQAQIRGIVGGGR